MRRLAICLTLVTFARAASACDMCSIYTSLDARESHPGFYLGVSTQTTDFDTLQEDGDEVDNDGESLESSMGQLVVGYQLNRRFGLQVNIPYVDRGFRRAVGHDFASGSESGLGDVAVVGHLRVAELYGTDLAFVWSVLGGVELPTGESDRLSEELDEEHHDLGAKHVVHSGVHGHDLALGNGATDFVIGTSVALAKSRFSLGASIQYAIRAEGDFDYRVANETSWAVAPGYFAWLSHGNSLNVGLAITGERKGRDEVAGVPADDTARRSFFVGPSVSYSHGARLHGELVVELPVDQSNDGLQIVPDWRLRLAMIRRF